MDLHVFLIDKLHEKSRYIHKLDPLFYSKSSGDMQITEVNKFEKIGLHASQQGAYMVTIWGYFRHSITP